MPPRILTRPALQFAILLLAALVLRCSSFGDPNLFGDETFYQAVGIAMHDGTLPYVDVWDRKPLGLFLIYYLIAGISSDPLAYQLTATLFAAATAAVICAIARRWTTVQGGLLAGLAYLFWLGPLHGFGGQTPVFYNLFIAAAAWLVLRGLPALRAGKSDAGIALAMLLAGMAITVKTTAVFEAAFLGLACVTVLVRSGAGVARTLRSALLWAMLGIAPALLIAATYWLLGHWSEFWHAMVLANLDKPAHLKSAGLRAAALFIRLAPLLALAAFGLLIQQRDRSFLLCWLGAALIGLCSVPNFYPHYALPLLVPLSLAASTFLARGVIGIAATVIVGAIAMLIASPFKFEQNRQSRDSFAALSQAIHTHDGGRGLFVYAGPAILYPMTGNRFPTPLVFPTHLSQTIEKDVSHLSTLGETRRVLEQKPGVVVIPVTIRNGPVNEETLALVARYIGENCRLITVRRAPDRLLADDLAVWGDCTSGADKEKAPAHGTGAFP